MVPSETHFKRIVEVNPKNRHEKQLIELEEGVSLGSILHSQGKLIVIGMYFGPKRRTNLGHYRSHPLKIILAV